jgi:hypothetical protein
VRIAIPQERSWLQFRRTIFTFLQSDAGRQICRRLKLIHPEKKTSSIWTPLLMASKLHELREKLDKN